MDISKFFNNLCYYGSRPNEKLEDKYFQLIHFYCDHCYPYISNKTTNFGIYKVPYCMSYEDFFKVLSYYTDKLDSISYPCSIEQVGYVSRLLCDCKVSDEECDTINSEIFPVYYVNGTINDGYKKSYEWYSKGISLDEVKRIYDKYGIEYKDAFEELLNDEKTVSRDVLVRSLTSGYKDTIYGKNRH